MHVALPASSWYWPLPHFVHFVSDAPEHPAFAYLPVPQELHFTQHLQPVLLT